MKTLMKHLWKTAVISVIVLFITTFKTIAVAPSTTVSPSEAVNIALFYYCLSLPNNDLVEIDEYVITPLYDEEGNITYYSVDFFLDNNPKGYVVIGADLEYIQCPELYHEGSSLYFENSKQELISIYYNPYEYSFISNNEVSTANYCNDSNNSVVVGLCEGDVHNNRAVLNMATNGDPLTDAISFAEHPMVYLQSLGYSSLTAGDYGTIETAMNNANAFNTMFPVTSTTPYYISSTGLYVRNNCHCVITAISNIMRYWNADCCPSYPSTYEATFSHVYNQAIQDTPFQNIYYPNNNGGVSGAYIEDLLMNINYYFGYYGQVAHSSGQDADWDFVTDYIDLGWPILLGITSTVSTFYPGGHMNIIFGYNNVSGIRNGQPENYSFIKIYDALANGGKRYVCWDMLTYYEWDSTNLTGINREMFAFCPYT